VLFIVVIVGGAVGVAVVDALFGFCSEEEEEEEADMSILLLELNK
jgi:hypothetical protein